MQIIMQIISRNLLLAEAKRRLVGNEADDRYILEYIEMLQKGASKIVVYNDDGYMDVSDLTDGEVQLLLSYDGEDGPLYAVNGVEMGQWAWFHCPQYIKVV